MKGAVFHDLLSNGLKGESISHLALEVKPIHLPGWRVGVAPPVPMYAQGADSRVSLLIARAHGGDAQAGKSGVALHRHHR